MVLNKQVHEYWVLQQRMEKRFWASWKRNIRFRFICPNEEESCVCMLGGRIIAPNSSACNVTETGSPLPSSDGMFVVVLPTTDRSWVIDELNKKDWLQKRVFSSSMQNSPQERKGTCLGNVRQNYLQRLKIWHWIPWRYSHWSLPWIISLKGLNIYYFTAATSLKAHKAVRIVKKWMKNEWMDGWMEDG